MRERAKVASEYAGRARGHRRAAHGGGPRARKCLRKIYQFFEDACYAESRITLPRVPSVSELPGFKDIW
jgi:hypothetical protein